MKLLTVLSVGIIVLCGPLAHAQRTLTVGKSQDYQYQTIQAAIDAAAPGDIVVVYPGTYAERIRLEGKNITVRGSNPTDPHTVSNTIIDGGGAGTVVTFAGAETEQCVLSGLYIWHGKAQNGGGVAGNGTRATIERNVIIGNIVSALGQPTYGAGLYDCDGIIRHNVIIGNRAEAYDTAVGGGLFGCDGTILNNTIVRNQILTTRRGFGAGLAGCNGLIDGNTIAENIIYTDGASGGLGGGLYSCNGTIQNNYIIDNEAHLNGGGLCRCNGIIQNNVVAGNLCLLDVAGWGGGFFDCNGTIRNNLITQNVAWQGGGGLSDCDAALVNNTIVANAVQVILGARPGAGLYRCFGPITNCIIWDNYGEADAEQTKYASIPTYSCIEEWTGGGTGNISDDPRFVDLDGADNDFFTYRDNDFHLAEGSPCIDAGDPNADLNDQCLPPGLGQPTADMGAYGGAFNCAPAPEPLLPELVVILTDFAPNPIVANQPITFVAAVENRGNVAFYGTSHIAFNLEDLAAPPGMPNAYTLADSIRFSVLAPGQRIELDVLAQNMMVRDDVPPGSSYALLIEVDPTNVAVESNEDNNIASWIPVTVLADAPNIVMSNLDFFPARIRAGGGDPIQFRGLIENTGTRRIRSPFWLNFYAWQGQFSTATATLLAPGVIIGSDPFLKPGQTFELASLPALATEALPDGVYTVGLVLDAVDQVAEQHESDNLVIAARVLRVGRGLLLRAKMWEIYE